jgi:glycosyltransferase involved in cell wall biosynthesis
MGSMHGPNFEAARWITAHLAPSLPQYDFIFIGSIADSLTGQVPANVRLIGQLSSFEKSRHLDAAHVGLNPMMSGSGSNVKMADYLQHGLPVLTTAFGARGYEWVPPSDAIVVELAEFEGELRQLMEPESTSEQAREARRASYSATLSMEAGGARLGRLIDEHEGPRKRALYVTYRYNEPARGGGEEYVVRLVHALAASGWEVDVASPAAERITDVNRFSAAFSGPDSQPIPVGRARVRSIKFPLDAVPAAHLAVQRVWDHQADYEENVAKSLIPPRQACIAWGWGDPETDGRWCFRNAGLYVPEGGALRFRARPLAPLWLQIFTQDGRRLHSAAIDGDLDLTSEIPAGFLSVRISMKEGATIADPRPLALFVTELALDGHSILDDHIKDMWDGPNSTEEKMAALAAARGAIRDPQGLELSSLRSASDLLEKYVRERVSDYDLLITHNAVFGGTTAAVAAAANNQIPSILIPHLHYDDDFYHFRDIQSACAMASATLVSPMSVKQLMADGGLGNVLYHSPGVDVSAEFSSDDVAAFRNVLPEPVGEFFLILGRKTAAKGYRDAIQALQGLPSDGPLMIVMIGPDDDGVLIDDPRVVYLGRQPDAVVRGALRECLGLINMSRSESFGMVLLEAGLAGKPVLANRSCAAFADIIEDGVNGFLVSRGELSTVMLRLQSEPALRTRLGKKGEGALEITIGIESRKNLFVFAIFW